ncbi:MAG: ABC transporter ATP-binding protein [Pseudomonadota bacterium]
MTAITSDIHLQPPLANTHGDAPIDAAFLKASQVSVTYPALHGRMSGVAAGSNSNVVLDGRDRVRGVRALNKVSVELRDGDRLAIVGRNGSGKTTLLQVLAGILAPHSGKIEKRGRSTSLINIALGVQPEATGHRNITLRGLAAGRRKEEIEAKRLEIAEFSELGDFLDMPVETYSAGMKMRLTFAIATAFEPEILILDEWLSAGDIAFKAKATKRMNEFVDKAGILVLASHSRKLMEENCDQALWIDAGCVVDVGPVKEIIDAYENHRKC